MCPEVVDVLSNYDKISAAWLSNPIYTAAEYNTVEFQRALENGVFGYDNSSLGRRLLELFL